MGKWAKRLFGRETFGDIGIIVGGNTSEDMERDVLRRNFDVVQSDRNHAFHAHLVGNSKELYPVVFNVYGAPAAVTVLAQMQDGGCKKVLFAGYTYSFRDLKVGDIVVPSKVYHFDGIYQAMGHEIGKPTHPDPALVYELEHTLGLAEINYSKGEHVSVPAVTLQLFHSNLRYGKIEPATLDMELASVYSRSREIGIRVAGVLVISDTRNHSLADEENMRIREERMGAVLDMLFRNMWWKFDFLQPLDNDFSIDGYLASVVEMPDGQGNVYRK